jgi:hypothetical protein
MLYGRFHVLDLDVVVIKTSITFIHQYIYSTGNTGTEKSCRSVNCTMNFESSRSP